MTTQHQHTVLISGGASGLGLALAKQFIKRGYNIALIDLNPSETVVQELQNQCLGEQKIQCWQADVSNFESLQQAMDSAETALGPASKIIHCAGINNACGEFNQLGRQAFEKVIQVNLLGSRNMADLALKQFQSLDPSIKPRLVLFGSMAGIVANYGYSPYCAAKFGVVGLAQVLRAEFKPKDIQVQLVCPPEVDTPMVVEEHKSIHPVTLKLKLMAGALSLEQAVDGIIKGIDKNRFLIIPGFKAKLIYFSNRYLPQWLLNSFVDKTIANTLKEIS